MADLVDDTATRLYGLPLEEFTRERDAAARELRRAKEREAADAVAKLKKPSQASWAANQLARERRDLVDDLLAAGEDLRAAQDAALAGEGADALRDAGAVERTAVEAMVTAAKELRPGGRRPTEATLERLRNTLHAAAGDGEVRTALDAGRLVADAEAAGAWGVLDMAAAAAEPAPRRRPARRAKPKQDTARDEKARAEREEAAREAREQRQRLEAELREARAERRARDRELGRAEREVARATGRLEDALAAADDAREQLDETREELESARKAAESAGDQVARLEEQLD
jgi:hypothetical protein